MRRDNELELRRRSAAMQSTGTSVSVDRDELLTDLRELLELRRRFSELDSITDEARRRHPNTVHGHEETVGDGA